MDGQLTALFRGARYIDSDYLALRRGSSPLTLPRSGDGGDDGGTASAVRIACGKDAHVRRAAKVPGASMKLVSKEALREMMTWGERYVQLADAKGELEPLAGLRRTRPL